jgi:single stranded DNA-binding protein
MKGSVTLHINVCTIVGRLSKDPELRYAENGTPVCSLVVGVEEHAGEKIYTTYLPVDITGRYAEQCFEDVSAGDEVMISGKLKYKSVVDKRTQEKTSKLIVSTWGIQQRIPSGMPQAERSEPSEGGDQGAETPAPSPPTPRRRPYPKPARGGGFASN